MTGSCIYYSIPPSKLLTRLVITGSSQIVFSLPDEVKENLCGHDVVGVGVAVPVAVSVAVGDNSLSVIRTTSTFIIRST